MRIEPPREFWSATTGTSCPCRDRKHDREQLNVAAVPVSTANRIDAASLDATLSREQASNLFDTDDLARVQ